MNIGKQIYELRKQKNIKQEELAAELGVSRFVGIYQELEML